MNRRREKIQEVMKALDRIAAPDETMRAMLSEKGLPVPKSGVRLFDLLKRNELFYTDLLRLNKDLPIAEESVIDQVEIRAHYEGYIHKQTEQVERFRHLEQTILPDDFDYMSMAALRTEARQKLASRRPANLGQASRIPGVSPSDISVLLVKIKQLKAGEA